MNSNALNLWDAWRSDSELEQFVESWITKLGGTWSDDDQQLSVWTYNNPDRAAAVMFAIMQITNEEKILAELGAGPLEDFLGVQGEAYVNIIHSLALEHKRLREVLNYVWQGAMSKQVWHRIEILKH